MRNYCCIFSFFVFSFHIPIECKENDLIAFECDNDSVMEIKYSKKDPLRFASLEYLNTTYLQQNLVMKASRKCSTFIVKATTGDAEETVIQLEDATPMKMMVNFSNLHQCQEILLQRYILYKHRPFYKYQEGDESEGSSRHNLSLFKTQNNTWKCYHRVII